ncbi:glycosyltransferase family 4 protein [Pseudomonadota bacterium]
MKPPRLLFASVGLQAGSGGTAELSRQALSSLLEMHEKGIIRLVVHVLEGQKSPVGDELLDSCKPYLHWHGGNRKTFALALVFTRANLRVLDHVGPARVLGLLPKGLRPSYVSFIHGIEIWNHDRPDYFRTAKNAVLLIANSEFTAERTRSVHENLPEIRVCWPGKDKRNQYAIVEGTEPEKIGAHMMLIVGRLDAEQRHKGHDHLLEAMPHILNVVPDAQLVVAGGGDDRARLERKASDLGVLGSVIFTGWVDDANLNRLYSQCALFVMPSEGDGFGIVFLEAMMHSKPCVGLKTGSAAEVFENGKSGILVDREDQEEMATHISHLLLNYTQRAQMGNAAFERYQAVFQGEHYSRRLQTILLDVLDC